MALTFDYVVNLSEGAIEPSVVEQSFITHEPSGDLLNYFVSGGFENEKVHTGAVEYDQLNFSKLTRRLTSLPVTRIGIKSFPAVGSYGFFKDRYSNLSRVLVPINIQFDRLTAPTISMTRQETSLTFNITAPPDVTYRCYRIVLVLNDFAYEYVTYERTITCDVPAVKGTYAIYCIGYVGEGQYVSNISNVLSLVVTEGKDSFEPDPTVSYYTKEQIDAMIGQIGSVLDTINGVEI